MYLQIEFKNGVTVDVALSGSHTVQVIAPNNTVQAAYGLNDVADVTFHQGDPPEPVAEPAPATVEPEAPVADPVPDETGDQAIAATNTAASPTFVIDTPQTSSNTVTSWAPAIADAQASAADAITEAAADAVIADAEPMLAQDDSAHADAVAQAQTAVADAPAAADQAQHVAQALADVETALAQWPDSPELLDAKAQLEQIGSQAA